MKNNLTAIVSALLLLTACSNQNESANTSSGTLIDTSMQNFPATTYQATSAIAPTDSSSVITTSPIPDAMQATAQQPVAVAAGMNPAHGEPGHRCEIAVGAPLNSAPAASAPAPGAISTPALTSTSQPPVTATTNAAPVVTAPGMNPPHGQPGHDCKIAVGAPLK